MINLEKRDLLNMETIHMINIEQSELLKPGDKTHY